MLKNSKNFCVLILSSIFLFSSVEASWITKKDKSSKEVIKENKQKSEWIKLKKKEIKKKNKEEFKKEEKKITKEVKSWITKKSKDSHINSIDKLPVSEIYFTGVSNESDRPFYGYINPDINSKKINDRYETSKGIVYFNDGKTTCKIGTTVLDVTLGRVIARISGKCSDGISFHGSFTETKKNVAIGTAATNKGESFIFNLNYDKKFIANLFEKNKKESVQTRVVERKLTPKQSKKILLKPNGKYYALLIGNSIYNDKNWDQLVSPVNDITEIKKVLDKSYKFEKIITVKNGTKKEIFNAFKELSKITTTNDYVLIYYSGHGETRAEQAYWIPKDGSSEWGNGDWININELNIFLTEIKAHHLAVMVDSCYVGGKFKGTNILDLKKDEVVDLYNQNLEDNIKLRSRSVLASGSSGRVSDTAAGTNHSRFALALINILETANNESMPLNMTNVALNVRLSFAGNFNQKPILYYPSTWQHLGGDFIFIPKKNLK